MKYSLVIFDLDGTLLDTLEDLAAAANGALACHGFPSRDMDEIRRFVGNGVARLIRRAVPEGTSDEICQSVLADFRRRYARDLNVRTRPYPGVPELLKRLREASVPAAVNSNKPDAAVQALCDAHFGSLITAALGERPEIAKKPAPDGALRLMRTVQAAAERTLYVGDGESDLLTAQNAGTDAAWVSWGFRTREELGGLAVPRAFDDARALGDYILDR